MAILHPQHLSIHRKDAGLFTEHSVLERLKHSLPENYEIFHQVDYFIVDEDGRGFPGELDIVVMSPNGNLLILEVKSGEVSIQNGKIFKTYSSSVKEVDRQCHYQQVNLRQRLRDANLNVSVNVCLVLPHFQIDRLSSVLFPRERIFCSDEFDHLGSKILELFTNEVTGRAEVEEVRRFLKNEFKVAPDLNVIKEQVSSSSKYLSSGLADWVPRITSPTGIYRVQATAGSGKTQLALKLLENALSNKQKSIYICFNRTLSDYVNEIIGSRTMVTTFHELCIDYYRKSHGTPNFKDENIFNIAVESYLAFIENSLIKYDLVVIDEGQDFEPEWIQGLLQLMTDNGNLYLLEDNNQRIYQRDEFDLDGAVLIECRENFRSPKEICRFINFYQLVPKQIESKSVYQGELPEFKVYESDKSLVKQTITAIDSLISKGFELSDIAVLTYRGKNNSIILNLDSIGKYDVRHFTGKYSDDGVQIWTDGNLFADSIYRFKGQSKSAVVITEIDFECLDELNRRKLFVGLTRAQLAVQLVISKHVEAELLNALE